MGRSPSPKRKKVKADESMPTPSGGQQKIDSYGKGGSNRGKYIRSNPRNGPVLNESPIEVRGLNFKILSLHLGGLWG